MDSRCRDHPGLVKFVRGSDVEIDSEICQIFILNILRFEFANILLLLCVAIVTNLSVFSLIKYICRIAHLFSFHKVYSFIITLTVNVVVNNLLQT